MHILNFSILFYANFMNIEIEIDKLLHKIKTLSK